MLQIVAKTLASATLSGGAQSAIAAGSLPARITTTHLTKNSVTNNAGSITWDADNTHYYVTGGDGAAAATVKKIHSGTGTVVWSVTVANAWACFRTSTFLYVCTQSTALKKLSFADGSVSATITMGLTGYRGCVVPGDETKAWICDDYRRGSVKEITLSTGVLTTRVVAGGAVYHGPLGLGHGAGLSGFFYVASASTVMKIQASDVSTAKSKALDASTIGQPGSNAGSIAIRGIGVTPAGVVYAQLGQNTNASTGGWIDYVDLEAGSPAWARAVATLPEWFGGAGPFVADEGSQTLHTPVAFSADGTLVALIALDRTLTTNNFTSVVVMRTGAQRARWSLAFTSAATLKSLMVGGQLRRAWDGVTDLRGAHVYYSTDGGSTRTEVVPGNILSVSITAGQTLTVDVDLYDWLRTPGPEPYVESMTIMYDDGQAAQAGGNDAFVGGREFLS